MDHHHSQKYSSSTRGAKSWLRNVCHVDWTCIFFIVTLGIATGLLQRVSAVQRPVFVGDETIAFPHRGSDSMPFWLALFIPAVLLLASASVLEFLLFSSQGARQAWLMLLNIVLAMLAALAVTGFMTELFKRICGRLRPDFLDRCKPAQPAAGAGLVVAYGTYPDVTCTASSGLKDGRLSFPSGHSSCSMAIGLFGALYVLWAVHCRAKRDALGPLTACRDGRVCMWAWLRAELLRLGVMLLVLFFICWPWGVGVSRFIDNRHNVSDIIGGFMLAACFAPLFLVRLVWHSSGWAAVQQQEESGWQVQPSPSAAASPVALPPISHELSGVQGNGHSLGMVNMHH